MLTYLQACYRLAEERMTRCSIISEELNRVLCGGCLIGHYHPKQKMRKETPKRVATACLTRGVAWLGLRERRNQKAAARANS